MQEKSHFIKLMRAQVRTAPGEVIFCASMKIPVMSRMDLLSGLRKKRSGYDPVSAFYQNGQDDKVLDLFSRRRTLEAAVER